MTYLKEINKRFNIINCIFYSSILSIIIYLIDNFNLLTYIYNHYKIISLCFLIIFVCFIIKEFINKKIWKLIYIETINYFDKIVFITLISELILFMFYSINNMHYKGIIFYSMMINALVVIFRLIKIEILYTKSKNKKTNAYSIFDLYNNSISNEELILLEEKALTNKKDDLLDISLFVDSIEDSLLQCKPKETFVISLIGKWGCGKTSVINLLKNKINNGNDAIIDTFNPWKYDNKLSLFEGFYNYIFKALDKNYGYFNYKNLLKKYENIIFNLIKDKTKISLDNIFSWSDEKDIEEIKNNINDCISFNSKKIIVVIDDIDRLDKEQVLLVFKTIKTLFDFNNIVYVLCYDEQRINNIFETELKIDSDYLNKIIQDKIVMPKIENNRLNEIGTKCIINLLNIYDINNYDNARLEKILNIIFENFNDLREIIRYINTISISIKSCNKIQLDICDYLALEYIKFQDMPLYNIIYNNSKMFVSIDREFGIDYDLLFDLDRFNNKAKEFFDDIFKGKDNIKKLLTNVFPYVDRYDNNYEIKSKCLFVTEERKTSILNKRCYNGKYFKCYFTIRHSFFTELSKLVDDFIRKINSNYDLEKCFDELVKSVNPNNHDLLFELLEMRIEEINQKKKIFDYIFNNVSEYEDNSRFLGFSSSERAKILLAAIISNESNIEIQKEYLDLICKKDLVLLDTILYWLSTDKYGNAKEGEIYKYGKKILCSELQNLIDNKTNIFDDSNYERHFCWLFYRNFDDKEKFKSYLKSLINKKTVFKAISECVSVWIGSGVRYEYKNNNLIELFGLDNLDDILKEVDYTLNNDQEKIKELYTNKNEKQFLNEINFDNL